METNGRWRHGRGDSKVVHEQTAPELRADVRQAMKDLHPARKQRDGPARGSLAGAINDDVYGQADVTLVQDNHL